MQIWNFPHEPRGSLETPVSCLQTTRLVGIMEKAVFLTVLTCYQFKTKPFFFSFYNNMENLELFSSLDCRFGRTQLNHWCPVVEFLMETIEFHHKSRKAICPHHSSRKFVLGPGGLIPGCGFTLPVLSPMLLMVECASSCTGLGCQLGWNYNTPPDREASTQSLAHSPSAGAGRESESEGQKQETKLEIMTA